MNWWGIYMATIVSLPAAVGFVVIVAVLTKPGGRR